MRTGEIIDLTNERRLSAVLDFTQLGGELLILNGGSRAEEFVVITAIDGAVHSEHRATYCIDSGTSMQLVVPATSSKTGADVTLRIIGGHGEMVLAPPRTHGVGRPNTMRGLSMLAAAAFLLILAGGPLDSPSILASADPEPAAADAPLISPGFSLRVPAQLPHVVAEPPVRRVALAADPRPRAISHLVEHRVTSAPLPVKQVVRPETPPPQMTDLRVPSTAKSGDFIPVSFGAVARQVKIVASIGPTIVSKTIIGAQHGIIAIRSPKSDLDSRVMTVRAYAQNGNRTATLQAMVVLVHP